MDEQQITEQYRSFYRAAIAKDRAGMEAVLDESFHLTHMEIYRRRGQYILKGEHLVAKEVMLVTGAGQIGLAIARRMGYGKKIVIATRRPKKAHETAYPRGGSSAGHDPDG